MESLTQSDHDGQVVVEILSTKFRAIHPPLEAALRIALMSAGLRKRGGAALHAAIVQFLLQMQKSHDVWVFSYQQWYKLYSYAHPETIKKALGELEQLHIIIREQGSWRGKKSRWRINTSELAKVYEAAR